MKKSKFWRRSFVSFAYIAASRKSLECALVYIKFGTYLVVEEGRLGREGRISGIIVGSGLFRRGHSYSKGGVFKRGCI